MGYLRANLGKSKKQKQQAKRKSTKEEREAELQWKKLNAQWDKLPKFARSPVSAIASKSYVPAKVVTRVTDQHPSKFEMGTAPLKQSQKYTGTSMLGVATMHKSSSVPVFSQEEAESIAKMRR